MEHEKILIKTFVMLFAIIVISNVIRKIIEQNYILAILSYITIPLALYIVFLVEKVKMDKYTLPKMLLAWIPAMFSEKVLRWI